MLWREEVALPPACTNTPRTPCAKEHRRRGERARVIWRKRNWTYLLSGRACVERSRCLFLLFLFFSRYTQWEPLERGGRNIAQLSLSSPERVKRFSHERSGWLEVSSAVAVQSLWTRRQRTAKLQTRSTSEPSCHYCTSQQSCRSEGRSLGLTSLLLLSVCVRERERAAFFSPACVDIAFMDGQRGFYEMENPTENPSKAAEYLKELNKIIETQQGLLEKQRVRIDELELQVTDLCKENACLKDQHQRHLATCRLQQGNHSTLGAIKENVMQEK